MDPALGAPTKMERRKDELTPMLSQYYELAAQYDECLLLFQVGDFYEAFCEAAETVARILEITLTQREDSTGTYAMAGIPIDNAESYIDTLLDAGYRVAIADQVQDPEETTGVVDRAVTRIITPGTLTEEELLTGDANNFVASLTQVDDTYGLALLDVSTGDFLATHADTASLIADEIGRFGPSEAITDLETAELFEDCMISPHRPKTFDPEYARDRFEAYFGSSKATLAPTAEIRACGALLTYAEYTRGDTTSPDRSLPPTAPAQLAYINHLTRYDPREYMLLDTAATQSLELFDRRGLRGADDATLIDILDETATAMGSRRLAEWLRRPLLDPDQIKARQEIIAILLQNVAVRERIRDRLEDVYDIERLVSRVARSRADARDLRSLAQTLHVVPDLQSMLSDTDDELATLRDQLDPVTDIAKQIEQAIVKDPPAEITDGGLIKEGYNDQLDELRATEQAGKAWIDELEKTERERTGIDSLKVGYNSVHGYYIEVTDANLERVPEDYQRRQTLKNSERYVTPELKRKEDEIVSAEGQADDLEYELFCKLRSTVAEEAPRLQQLADAIADLDALANLAEIAAKYDYTCPEITERQQLHIQAGRHPIVERRQESFVPNDTTMEPDRRFLVITGPNMSGKSTYMRQVALIQILAQIGSFVPADQASLSPVNRIFTRIGASDDIAGGRSTFMIEMLEVAEILRSADDSALVVLDEVGRGTSTADGLALAKSITRHIHDQLEAFTLFATHHHELTATAAELSKATNVHFEAKHVKGDIEFSHTLDEGPATASYGIEVAREAGVPEPVVEDARTRLEDQSQSSLQSKDQLEELQETLETIDIATTTPVEALNRLAELKRKLE